MADIATILSEIGARLRKLESREHGGTSPIVSIAASQALKAAHQTALVNAGGGAVVLTLPPASSARYVVIAVKKIDASANTVTLDGDGAETIDGAATQVITVQWDSMQVWGSGSAWFIVAKT